MRHELMVCLNCGIGVNNPVGPQVCRICAESRRVCRLDPVPSELLSTQVPPQ
jgi:hypothetical protein